MDNVAKAKKILADIRYITVATVSKDGQPWNSPVSAYFDEQYNFYWASWKENQHSINIRHNQDVFIVIYDSRAPEGTGEGVYIKAKAYELTNREEVDIALQYRSKSKAARKPGEYLGDFPRRIYKAVPEKFWINGDGEVDGNFVDVRTEVSGLL